MFGSQATVSLKKETSVEEGKIDYGKEMKYCHNLFYLTNLAGIQLFYSEDLVALGGFKQKDRSDTNVIISDTESILAMCKRLVPSLKVKHASNIFTIPKFSAVKTFCF